MLILPLNWNPQFRGKSCFYLYAIDRQADIGIINSINNDEPDIFPNPIASKYIQLMRERLS